MFKIRDLVKQLNESSKNLSKDNKKIFDEIIVYVRTSNIKTRDAEEFLQQILDSILNAENQGLSIEEVLGSSDIKGYCKEVINTYKESYNLLSLSSEYVMYAGTVIFILPFFHYIFNTIPSIAKYGLNNLTFNLTIDLKLIFQIPLLVLMIIFTMKAVRKSCFKSSSKYYKIKEFFILWILSILLILLLVATHFVFNNIFLFNVNIFIILFIGTILYFSGNYLSEQ